MPSLIAGVPKKIRIVNNIPAVMSPIRSYWLEEHWFRAYFPEIMTIEFQRAAGAQFCIEGRTGQHQDEPGHLAGEVSQAPVKQTRFAGFVAATTR